MLCDSCSRIVPQCVQLVVVVLAVVVADDAACLPTTARPRLYLDEIYPLHRKEVTAAVRDVTTCKSVQATVPASPARRYSHAQCDDGGRCLRRVRQTRAAVDVFVKMAPRRSSRDLTTSV